MSAKKSENVSIANQNFELISVPFAKLEQTLTIDKDVEREPIKQKVSEIQHYIANSLNNNQLAVFPPLVVSSRKKDGQNVILDGQHRFLALTTIAVNKDFSANQVIDINEALKNYQCPVMIINSDSVEIERQIFSDINFNATKVARSLAIAFNSRDYVQKTINEIFNKHKSLKDIINISHGEPTDTQIIKSSIMYDAVNQLLYGKTKPTEKSKLVSPKQTGLPKEEIVEKWLLYVAENVVTSNKKDIRNNGAFIQAIAVFTHNLIETDSNWLETLDKTIKNAFNKLNDSNNKVLVEQDFNVNEDGKVIIAGTGVAIKGFSSFLNNCTPE